MYRVYQQRLQSFDSGGLYCELKVFKFDHERFEVRVRYLRGAQINFQDRHNLTLR